VTSKQAQRSKQKKAQKRKKQLATRRMPSAPDDDLAYLDSLLRGTWPLIPGAPMSALGITPEDYLPDGQIKVSAALLAIARPILDAQNITSLDAVRKLLMVAVIGWNLHVSEAVGVDPSPLLQGFEEEIPADSHDVMRTMVAYFQGMKRSLFPDDRRVLLDLNVIGDDDHWRVNVKSVIPRA
jgi:hypothetical protein